MSLTPYYTEVISLSVSSMQPDLKKGKTTRVEGDGTRENHYWPQSREVRTVSKFTLEFTLVFKTTLLSTTRFSCGTELTKLKTEGKCRDIKREKKKER